MFRLSRGRLRIQPHEQGWDEPGRGSVPPWQGGRLQSGHRPHNERIQWPSVPWEHPSGHCPAGRRQHHHTGRRQRGCRGGASDQWRWDWCTRELLLRARTSIVLQTKFCCFLAVVIQSLFRLGSHTWLHYEMAKMLRMCKRKLARNLVHHR